MTATLSFLPAHPAEAELRQEAASLHAEAIRCAVQADRLERDSRWLRAAAARLARAADALSAVGPAEADRLLDLFHAHRDPRQLRLPGVPHLVA